LEPGPDRQRSRASAPQAELETEPGYFEEDYQQQAEDQHPPAPAASPPARPAGRTGRPKGVPKVKKTFYLTSGVDNLKEAQRDLVKKADIFIKDESEVADLALALLANTLADPAGVQTVIEVYNNRMKGNL
jgi:hypothetical protein